MYDSTYKENIYNISVKGHLRLGCGVYSAVYRNFLPFKVKEEVFLRQLFYRKNTMMKWKIYFQKNKTRVLCKRLYFHCAAYFVPPPPAAGRKICQLPAKSCLGTMTCL